MMKSLANLDLEIIEYEIEWTSNQRGHNQYEVISTGLISTVRKRRRLLLPARTTTVGNLELYITLNIL
jgi:hypothetical protein